MTLHISEFNHGQFQEYDWSESTMVWKNQYSFMSTPNARSKEKDLFVKMLMDNDHKDEKLAKMSKTGLHSSIDYLRKISPLDFIV